MEKKAPVCSPEVGRKIREAWETECLDKTFKIVVIDDDPTGTQTVHDIPVYTHWDMKSICDGFDDDSSMFYILTNSRGMKEWETEKLHKQLGKNLVEASRKKGMKFLLISRGDSTLRGHYPLETQCLAQAIAEQGGPNMDGEILIPFFKEGERYTANDVHYVVQEAEWIPVGETEFAQDLTFFYHSSNLNNWIEEKTKGKVKAEDVISFSLDQLRGESPDSIAQRLQGVDHFSRIIVNAVCEEDLMAFCCGFVKAVKNGKNFLVRSASSFPYILGKIKPKPLLSRKEIFSHAENACRIEAGQSGSFCNCRGLVVIGSHVKKSSDQMIFLLQNKRLGPVEFNQHLILNKDAIYQEQKRAAQLCDGYLREGRTAVLYTRRERMDLNTGNPEDELSLAVRISEALAGILHLMEERPDFLVAKGGITSSDMAVKGLGISRAMVLGQILPGVSVWIGDRQSRYAGIPYVVFPGNVGGREALKEVVDVLEGREKPVIAMLIGDGSGIGPELVVKMAQKGILEETARPILVGDVNLWKMALERFGAGIRWKEFPSVQEVDWSHGIPVVDVGEQDPNQIHIGQADERCGAACIQMLKTAVLWFQEGWIQGMCYAPLNKRAMKMAHSPADSEIELLAMLFGKKDGYGEINILDDVLTTRVTSHIPLKDVSSQLSKKKIENSIELADSTLRRMGAGAHRIGVCALNPHGGEGGLCGEEEISVIAPAVNTMRERGIKVQGPLPADTLFKHAFDGKFDAIVTMYHDQGQIALKLKGFERGVTVGGGLEMPVATCAHGTAHEIAWKGTASPQSLEHAYGVVCRMAKYEND